MKTIDVIFNNLMNGNHYGYVVKNVRFPYFHSVLVKHPHKPFFCWSHAGSSANKANKKELAWLIENIFRMTPEEFVNRYECRTYTETLKEVI